MSGYVWKFVDLNSHKKEPIPEGKPTLVSCEIKARVLRYRIKKLKALLQYQELVQQTWFMPQAAPLQPPTVNLADVDTELLLCESALAHTALVVESLKDTSLPPLGYAEPTRA